MNSSQFLNQILGSVRRSLAGAGAFLRSIRAATPAAGIAALALCVGAPAGATVFNYGTAGSLHTVNAGILQLDSNNQVSGGQFTDGNSSGALYSFYILDNRTDYKPAGWRFVNPLAPTTVTSDLQNAFPGAYTTGQEVTPDMAVYWMVNLPSIAGGYVPGQTNPLSQYDVLAIRVSSSNPVKYMGLSRAEREMLRDYVDQGGTLWIEDAGGANTLIPDSDVSRSTPAGLFVDVAFNDGSLSGSPYVSDGDHRHPTLTVPNFLTIPEMSGLSYNTGGVLPDYLSSLSGASVAPDYDFLSSVMGNSAAPGQLPSISAGDFGSGHVVIDDCNILGGISDATLVNGVDKGIASSLLTGAQPSDLQFAYNVIAWSGSESVTDGADVRHSGAQTSAEIGNSLLGNWAYPYTRQATVPGVTGVGVAIAGNIAYVTSMDGPAGGSTVPMIHAFDINPAEDLNQDNNPDDGDYVSGASTQPADPTTGIGYLQDYSAGLNYDELWAAQVGSSSAVSAPAIATLPNTVLKLNPNGYYDTVVVEDRTGNLYLYDATSNPEGQAPLIAPINTNSGTTFLGTTIPTPVYSHGWLVAPQPSTGIPSVYLVYFGGGASSSPSQYKVALYSATTQIAATDTSSITVTPAIAMVPSTDSKFGGSDVVAYVATQHAIYPLLLGSRDEQDEGSSQNGFSTKISALVGANSPIEGVSNLLPAPEDAYNDNGPYCTYLSPTDDWNTGASGLDHVPNFRATTFSNLTANPSLRNSETVSSVYSDYDVVPGTAAGGSGASTPAVLSRHQIIATPGGTITASTVIQGMAVGPDNTLYVTVNEAGGAYIEAIQEQNPDLNFTSTNGTVIKWRYSIGADSTYAPTGLNSGKCQFIGSPVVDKGHVYALAETAQNQACVLCFNPNATFTIAVGTITQGSVSLQQTDENGIVNSIAQSQYTITDTQAGTINITNFSPQSTGVYQVWPNLSVSIPLTGNLGGNSPSDTNVSISSNSNGAPLLLWSSPLITSNGSVFSPLREFGNYLYFGNGVSSGQTQVVSVDASTGTQVTTTSVPSTVQVSAGLAASGNDVIGVGGNGVVGMAYAGTMVADSNRLIEYAPDGSPMWSLDSTTQEAPVYDTNDKNTVATTNVSLSRPSSVTLLAPNDILFADTGNNRCVRVDRGGNVLWELTSFSDPTGLLTPGEPLNLNDPTSVVEWREVLPQASVSSPSETIEHYLISDSGNSRVIEVDDVYTNGKIYSTDPQEYHVLRWVSRTFDKAGRSYRYVYANRYTSGNSTTAILAGVANRQVAPLIPAGTSAILDSANRDTAGSSILLLNYYPTTNPALNSNAKLPSGAAVTAYQFPSYSGTPSNSSGTYGDPGNGLPYGVIDRIIYGTNANPVAIPIRNLRYVNAYNPTGQTYNASGSSTSTENIVIADDDGVFDGAAFSLYNSATFSIVAIPDYTPASGSAQNNSIGFAFTPASYNNLATASAGTANPFPSNAFSPTSVQRLDNGDYLITNGAAAGDAAPSVVSTYTADVSNNLAHFGGDVIEVNPAYALVGTVFGRAKTSSTQAQSNNSTTTSALSTPAFATRAQ